MTAISGPREDPCSCLPASPSARCCCGTELILRHRSRWRTSRHCSMRELEATSFVSTSKMPALAYTAELSASPARACVMAKPSSAEHNVSAQPIIRHDCPRIGRSRPKRSPSLAVIAIVEIPCK